MGKAEVLVALCSLIIIALFFVFLFLMSTVNPPPLVTETPDTPILVTDAPARASDARNDKFVNFYFRNNMDPSEDVGMEKVIVTGSTSAPLVSFYPHHLENLFPSAQYKNPNLVKVYPPVWVPVPAIEPNVTTFEITLSAAGSKQNTSSRKSHTTTGNKAHNSTETKPDIKDTKTSGNANKLPLIQRRSVNVEKKVDENTGSVILRILDDYGQSRIEIKLNPNEMFENKQMRKHISSCKGNKQLDNANARLDSDENTEIEILPNSTVIINNHMNWKDENGNIHNKPVHNKTQNDKSFKENKSNITSKHPKDKVESIEATNANHKEIFSSDKNLNLTSTTSLVLKVIFDNVTRSFTDLNNSVSNNLTVFELK